MDPATTGAAAAAPAPASPKRTRAKRPAAAAPGEAEGAAAGGAPAASPAPSKRASRATGSTGKRQAGAAATEVPATAGRAPASAGAAVAPPPPAATKEGAPKRAPPRKQKEPAQPLVRYSEALRPPPPPAGSATKLLSWNVAGLRGLLKKDPEAITRLVAREGVEVVCLQEHKLQDSHCTGIESSMGLKGWSHAWTCSTAKLGYSGVSIASRTPPLSVAVGLGGAPGSEHEGEGRVLTAEFADFFLVNAYVPNSGDGLKRLEYRVESWDAAFAAYLRSLEARGKAVLLTGDLNCAHQEIDIHSPKTNLRSAGFTKEERDSFGKQLVAPGGFLTDTFRAQFPDTIAYTYYSLRTRARESGKGWRLDYWLASQGLLPRVHDSWLLPDVLGSDHVPIGITLRR